MTKIPLTSRPRVPVLVSATALGTLAFASMACGDDGSSSTSAVSTDVAPTAGPCYHDPTSPGCETTSGGTMGSSTGMADSNTDVAPTAGPCYHDPNDPECESTGASTTSTDTGTGTSSGTGTDTGTSTG